MNKYIMTPIRDIGTIVTGKTPATSEKHYYDGKYMFITPVELHDGYNIICSGKTITEAGLHSIATNSIDGTSVLVGCIGWDMGNVAMCHERCATNQQINSITNFKPQYNPYYTYYWLSQKKEYLFSIASITRTPILSKSAFEEVTIPMPSKEVQDSIVAVLRSFDEKIAVNKRICTELEAMAKTIYDYWFTQFDFPDENGKPYRTSGGEMVWNEQLKREIPKGWEVKCIEDCCNIVDCLHSKKPEMTYEDDTYYLLQLDNLVELGLIDLSKKYYVKKDEYDLWTSKIEVVDGDLVVTNAGRIGAVSRIPNHVSSGIGRNMTAIRARTIPYFFLYYFFTSPDFTVQMRANTDSGAFFGSLNVRGIKQLLLTMPPAGSDILIHFDNIVEPIRRKIEMTHQESHELTKLRDWLLPMLMNGQTVVGE